MRLRRRRRERSGETSRRGGHDSKQWQVSVHAGNYIRAVPLQVVRSGLFNGALPNTKSNVSGRTRMPSRLPAVGWIVAELCSYELAFPVLRKFTPTFSAQHCICAFLNGVPGWRTKCRESNTRTRTPSTRKKSPHPTEHAACGFSGLFWGDLELRLLLAVHVLERTNLQPTAHHNPARASVDQRWACHQDVRGADTRFTRASPSAGIESGAPPC